VREWSSSGLDVRQRLYQSGVHVSVVFFVCAANYPRQCRKPRLCVFRSRIIPPSILPRNDHFLNLFPPDLRMNVNEILHPTNRARQAHPNEHTCGHGRARRRQWLSRDGIDYSPISINQIRGRCGGAVLHSLLDNINGELANCLDAEFETTGIVKLRERRAYGGSMLLREGSSLSQAAGRTRGWAPF